MKRKNGTAVSDAPIAPVAVAPIEEARAAAAVTRGDVKLVESDAMELRTLDDLLGQALLRLGRLRLDALTGVAPAIVEYGAVVDALRARERYAQRVQEIGVANGVPVGKEPWTFDFAAMRFFRTPLPPTATAEAGA